MSSETKTGEAERGVPSLELERGEGELAIGTVGMAPGRPCD